MREEEGGLLEGAGTGLGTARQRGHGPCSPFSPSGLGGDSLVGRLLEVRLGQPCSVLAPLSKFPHSVGHCRGADPRLGPRQAWEKRASLRVYSGTGSRFLHRNTTLPALIGKLGPDRTIVFKTLCH